MHTPALGYSTPPASKFVKSSPIAPADLLAGGKNALHAIYLSASSLLAAAIALSLLDVCGAKCGESVAGGIEPGETGEEIQA